MKPFSTFVLLLFVLTATCLMLLYPQAVYDGARQGLTTWMTHLLPSLLPFFMAANLMLSLGFVHFLGVLLEPLMRPVFHLPGEAGFAVALGFTSGFPTGAVLTASLKEQHLCTTQEAARLATFTNNSSPLFLLVAIPVSMLHRPELGLLLLLAHDLANLTIGFLLRFTEPAAPTIVPQYLWRTAFQQMRQYQLQHPQPFGKLLSQAIQKSIDSIIKIGGFVFLFSVLVSLLQAANLFSALQALFSALLQFFHITPTLSTAMGLGFFEMTLGTQTASETSATLLEQLIVISFLLGWSGISVQAQVSSILAEQQISSKLYCLCRPLQGILAALYIPLLISLFPHLLTVPVSVSLVVAHTPYSRFCSFFYPCFYFFAILCILLFASGIFRFVQFIQQSIQQSIQ